LTFSSSSLAGPKYDEFVNALADHGVVFHNDSRHFSIRDKSDAPLWDLLQEEVYTTHPTIDPLSKSQSATFDDIFSNQVYLDFPVRYQLEACLSNGFLQEHTITREFLEKLAECPSALNLLEKVMDKQTVYYNPMDVFNIRLKGQGNLTKRVPSYCFLARSVTITPTMMHVATPAVETSNRIIRKNAKDADRFIRVKFTDEKTGGRLSNQGRSSEVVFNRVARALERGIVVAGRYYVFLAFGNSQFRENSAYFYASTVSRSADDIRRALGTFDHIKTIAKFGARLGQCFSTTRYIASSKALKMQMIPDIERNGFMFTDGVGKISLFLAKMAAEELGLPNAWEDPPSLFQFRLAGCKGVLALDPTISGKEVHIRKSQYKFPAEFDGLEIIRASAFATAYFNRQLIVVLSTLGVPVHVFIRKQQEWIDCLAQVTEDETVALEKLQRNVDINQVSLTMAGMILDGFMSVRDPFLMSLLHLWRAYNIKALKEKARIFIEKGAFVLGCVDETATLHGHFNEEQDRPGMTREEKLSHLPEIFLQVSDTAKPGHYKVITGVCVLARNPSLHAGDVRIVRAIDVPALHHLKDVVVLPQTGDRDLANMCSGGDLDGDDYLVMWDPEFIPYTINEEPMDFTPDKPDELDRDITIRDLTEFFVTYMKNDSLGQIAHAHLAQADWSPEGVRDWKCLELAKLHSQAVDYPKSGIRAVMLRELKPSKWPHFMEKKYMPANKIYRSRGVLGKLYDRVELVDFKPQYDLEFDTRILDAFELSEDILSAAAEIKVNYDTAIRRLMAKHAIRTEFEVWSIFVLAHNQDRRDYKFAEEFGATVDAVKDQYKEACRNAAPGKDLLRFVAAMYTVTARELKAALREMEESDEADHYEQLKKNDKKEALTKENRTAENGSTEDGSTENGSTGNGSTGNGSTENGLTENGLTEDGLIENGLTENGLTEDGLIENGLAENGLTENGLTENEVTGAETTKDEVTGDETTEDEATDVTEDDTTDVTEDEVTEMTGNDMSEDRMREDGKDVLGGGPKPMPLISFPWLFHRELGTIATGARRKSVSVQQSHLKKTKRPTVGVESGSAEVETKQGVTHLGEVLDLDFNLSL
jgi:RNA-dependent RNA polymerase